MQMFGGKKRHSGFLSSQTSCAGFSQLCGLSSFSLEIAVLSVGFVVVVVLLSCLMTLG